MFLPLDPAPDPWLEDPEDREELEELDALKCPDLDAGLSEDPELPWPADLWEERPPLEPLVPVEAADEFLVFRSEPMEPTSDEAGDIDMAELGEADGEAPGNTYNSES